MNLELKDSKEQPLSQLGGDRNPPGSNPFVPSAAGLVLASEVVRDLTNNVARDELRR